MKCVPKEERKKQKSQIKVKYTATYFDVMVLKHLSKQHIIEELSFLSKVIDK